MATRPEQREAYATKLVLISVFLVGFLGFAGRPAVQRRHKRRLDLPAADLLLLIGSTFRMGRLVAFDEVFAPLRAPLTLTKPDESGAGEVVVPKGHGMRRTLGELISCPICAGTWISAALVYALHLFPSPTRVFLTIMGTIGWVEMLNAMTEFLSWSGTQARKESGAEA